MNHGTLSYVARAARKLQPESIFLEFPHVPAVNICNKWNKRELVVKWVTKNSQTACNSRALRTLRLFHDPTDSGMEPVNKLLLFRFPSATSGNPALNIVKPSQFPTESGNEPENFTTERTKISKNVRNMLRS